MASAVGGKTSERNKVICLLCDEDNRVMLDCSLGHIENHLSFKKYACNKCPYKTTTEESSIVHSWETGHQMRCCKNEYVGLLASKIYMDCLRATDFGIKRVLNGLQAECLNRSRKAESSGSSKIVFNEEQHQQQHLQQNAFEDTVEVNNKANPMMFQNRNDNFEEVENTENESQWNTHSIIDESVQNNSKSVQKASSCKIKITQKKRRTISDSQITTLSTVPCAEVTSSTDEVKRKKKKRNSTSQETESRNESATFEVQILEVPSKNTDKTASSIDEAPQSDAEQFDSALESKQFDKVVCRKCGKKTRNDYVRLRRHVTRCHHNNDVDENDFDEVLSSEIRSCFPGSIIYSDLQCNECGREYKSESGRKYHVIRDHMKRMMNCVIHGCTMKVNCPAALKLHIQNEHKMVISTETNADVFRVFLCAKKKFDAALAAEVIRYFPINLNSRTVNSAVPSTVNNSRTSVKNEKAMEADIKPSQEITASLPAQMQKLSASDLRTKLETAQPQTEAQFLQINQQRQQASPSSSTAITDCTNKSNNPSMITMLPTRCRNTLLPTPPMPPANNVHSSQSPSRRQATSTNSLGSTSIPYSTTSSHSTDQQSHQYDSTNNNTNATSNNHSSEYSSSLRRPQHTPYQKSPSFRNDSSLKVDGQQHIQQQQRQQEQYNQYGSGYARYQYDHGSGATDTDNMERYTCRTPDSQVMHCNSVQPSQHTKFHSDSTTKCHRSEENYRHVHTNHNPKNKPNVLSSKRGINKRISEHKRRLKSTQPTNSISKCENQQSNFRYDHSSSFHPPGNSLVIAAETLPNNEPAPLKNPLNKKKQSRAKKTKKEPLTPNKTKKERPPKASASKKCPLVSNVASSRPSKKALLCDASKAHKQESKRQKRKRLALLSKVNSKQTPVKRRDAQLLSSTIKCEPNISPTTTFHQWDSQQHVDSTHSLDEPDSLDMSIKTEASDYISATRTPTRWSGKRIRLDQNQQSPAYDPNSINISSLHLIGRQIGLMKKEFQDDVP